MIQFRALRSMGFKGALIKSDQNETWEEDLTLSQCHINMPPLVQEARVALNDYRAEHDIVTPCQIRPRMFDTNEYFPNGRKAETREEYSERVIQASDECIGACRAFVPCLAISTRLSVEVPEITGVLAGKLHDPTADGKQICRLHAQRGATE